MIRPAGIKELSKSKYCVVYISGQRVVLNRGAQTRFMLEPKPKRGVWTIKWSPITVVPISCSNIPL